MTEMDAAPFEFLNNLLNSPAPSGYEEPIQSVVREYASGFADDVSTDWHGNVIAAVNPDAPLRVMLAGHCDQIGLMVKYIDENGFISVDTIGGWDVQMLIGQTLTVWSDNGPVPGVIARKAIHLLSDSERKTVPQIKDLWIDIGAEDRAEAESLVSVGDPVTLKLGMTKLRGQLVSGPGMDDRVGVWVVMEALRQVAAGSSDVGVFAVSTVQEEIGLRGARTSAHSIDPHVGIAVDVTHATDCPGIDATQYGEIKIDAGPVVFRGPNVNGKVFTDLTKIATDAEIKIQPQGLSRAASNDGNALQVTRGGLATGIIGIPNRYMHSPVEVVSLRDLTRAADLIARFCLNLTPESDFTPGSD